MSDSQQTEKSTVACPGCNTEQRKTEIAEALQCCPSCGYHFRMEVGERLAYIADEGSFSEFFEDLAPQNPIKLHGYEEKIIQAEQKTRLKDAVVTGACRIDGKDTVLAVMSFSFMGGSMGSVVGEKICRAMEKAIELKAPLVIFATSGGARMQEGIFSLMQMAKTSSCAADMDRTGIPYFAVLCDPTTGGVTASFAMLSDIAIAEPGALIGFAGPRIIEGTIRETLPEGFQRAEFLLEKGFIDMIAKRSEQKSLLSRLIDLHPIK